MKRLAVRRLQVLVVVGAGTLTACGSAGTPAASSGGSTQSSSGASSTPGASSPAGGAGSGSQGSFTASGQVNATFPLASTSQCPAIASATATGSDGEFELYVYRLGGPTPEAGSDANESVFDFRTFAPGATSFPNANAELDFFFYPMGTSAPYYAWQVEGSGGGGTAVGSGSVQTNAGGTSGSISVHLMPASNYNSLATASEMVQGSWSC
ncbi:MAG: hypothetical protein JOY80_09700 [Candidatus Dormibacteraeota bacterium]|nr:hypothetical protein [Candidatus Dormibacteraeota bacterium]